MSRTTNGFTLIELLVAISIIGLLSAVVLAATAQVRVKGRDSLRSSETHQMDLAIQLYYSSTGHVPNLQGTCGNVNVGAGITLSNVTNCEALSTASAATPQLTAWNNFIMDLLPYMPALATLKDPCPTCSSASSYPIGYTYIAPAAMNLGGLCTGSACDATYQIYAGLEKNASPCGYSPTTNSSAFINPIPVASNASVSCSIDSIAMITNPNQVASVILAAAGTTAYTVTGHMVTSGFTGTVSSYSWSASGGGGASPTSGNTSSFVIRFSDNTQGSTVNITASSASPAQTASQTCTISAPASQQTTS